MTTSLIDELLGPLHMHFVSARAAYGLYLANGRTFLLARSLRCINLSARSLLISKGHLLPADRQQDAAALICHYDIWLTLWIDHRRRLQPELNDIFVFENSFTYPKEAESRLEALYETLSAEAAATGRSDQAQTALDTSGE